ncbi:MAG: leucine-rich repeat domain-containing protein, partial [Rickettsiales bacterium]|nr:leucine-rich repeat domain-containing protein [Rickettsiales bacterium]
MISYKDWSFDAKDKSAAAKLRAYIDEINDSGRIPDSDNAGTITHSAFDGITYLRIPEHITEIGDCAFAKNSDLKAIELPGVTRLGADCFNGAAIEKISADKVADIGNYCFWHCNNLVELALPGLVRAGSRSISKCAKLQRVSLPILAEFSKLIYSCPNLEYANIGGNSDKLLVKFDLDTVQLCPKLQTLVLSSMMPSPLRFACSEQWIKNKGIESKLSEYMARDIKIIYGQGGHNPGKIQDAPSQIEQEPAGEEKPKIKYKIDKNGWIAVCASKKTRAAILRLAESREMLSPGDINTEMSAFTDLISISLPDYVTEIPAFCFAQCYDL